MVLHPIYMPFEKKQLRRHFAKVRVQGQCVETTGHHIPQYIKSIERYEAFQKEHGPRLALPLSTVRFPCQIEKDERFWTASSVLTLFYSPKRVEELSRLLQLAYGEKPPVDGWSSWASCLEGELFLFFEANLPSPALYKQWLRDHLRERQFIPYVLQSDNGRKNLEGPTNVDALLLNASNGFAVVIEAKVLSDVSCQITYDVQRNQIARNIDVMLEENASLCPPLHQRDPSRTFFLLVTPEIFKRNPSSRLYGFLMREYRQDPLALARDLPHRSGLEAREVAQRIGWVTWENMQGINSGSCSWLHERLE